MKNIVILISWSVVPTWRRSSPLRDAGTLPVNIVAVISKPPEAFGLETAARAGSIVGITSTTRPLPGAKPSTPRWPRHRPASPPTWSCSPVLCAFSAKAFVRHYEGRLLNIHPRCCRPPSA